MKLNRSNLTGQPRRENASVLVIVLWICLGLVSISLYFAHSMTFELRAADNRVNGIVSDQAIEGAARYVSYVLQNYATNGAVPDKSLFKCEAVEVGDAKFWLIGRDPSSGNSSEPYFGLVDEGGKVDLNSTNIPITNTLSYLPGMTSDFAEAITDWRKTNGTLTLNYSSLGYSPKYAPFESVDELRLVSGATVDTLAGEDINRNGVLDKNEKDLNGNGEADPGLFEDVTVWTREPNYHSDGTTKTNINDTSFRTQQDLSTALTALFRDDGVSNPGGSAGNIARALRPPNNPAVAVNGLYHFAFICRQANMSAEDFAKISDDVTTVPSTTTYISGRVNVNTASETVLTALFSSLNNVDEQTAASAAQTLVTYREQNPASLGSLAWVFDALGNNNVRDALTKGDFITTKSFQFTADIAAVGAFGRGYRRVKFIFDTTDGTPKILYRQDLSRLGWALGDKTRETLLAKNTQ